MNSAEQQKIRTNQMIKIEMDQGNRGVQRRKNLSEVSHVVEGSVQRDTKVSVIFGNYCHYDLGKRTFWRIQGIQTGVG